MIGLVMATPMEAQPFLEHQKWRRIDDGPVTLYQTEIGPEKIGIMLAVSGIGKVSSAVAAHLLICCHGVDGIFNFGVCGALGSGKDFDPGKIYRISSAVEGDRKDGPRPALPEPCHSHPFNLLPALRLVTYDQPVFNRRLKNELSNLGDLVDMEGAAIAKVANMYSLPCVLIKGVTDGAEEDNRNLLIQNMDGVSRKLAALFFETMALLS